MKKKRETSRKDMKPIIFDYNGTLFFDADINEWAWRQTINELSKGTVDFDEIYKEFKSTRNYLFVKNVFKRLGLPLDDDQINYWAKRKETEYYHRFCRENKRKELAPGAEKFLNYLKENDVPYNLCTASIIENVDLYFDYIGLNRWFDKEKIAYDDGTFENKIKMYQKAAERIGSRIEDCTVFEDSLKSISEAAKAGCSHIIAIKNYDPDIKEIIAVINDFTELDYSIL